jgi:glycosyltransferase involved in cell wall biosynthesis
MTLSLFESVEKQLNDGENTLSQNQVSPSNQLNWFWHDSASCLQQSLNDSIYPRISIITPSYNQGQFIEETIRSVLLQGYPNLEYIIIDGGSTDCTIEIIKKYQQWITYWVSEPDRGQAHAINKGIERSTGTILGYLNSDDYYLPGTLSKIARYFNQFPDTALLHGRCFYVNEIGEKVGEQFGDIQYLEEILNLWDVWWKKRQFVQPEVFWSKQITEQVGRFNEELNFVMDYEYWCRILQLSGKVGQLDSEVACFRLTKTQKSKHYESVATELLEVVQPLIWSSSSSLSTKQRLLLQGNWLYQVNFLRQVDSSLEIGDSKLIRWLKLIKLIFNHPKILLASRFHQRVNQLFFPSFHLKQHQ